MGSRGIYHDGWMASTFGPRVPWLPGLPPEFKTGHPTTTVGSSITSTRTGHRPTNPGRRDARKARPDARTVRHRGRAKPGAPDRWRLVGAEFSIPNCASRRRIGSGTFPVRSPVCPSSVHPRWATRTTPSPLKPNCPPTPTEFSTLSAASPAGSPATSTTGTCATSTTVSYSPAPDSLDRQTAGRSNHDRRGNPLCRTASRWTARDHHSRGAGDRRNGAGAGQRAAAVHCQRLFRHRRLPRFTRVGRLLTDKAPFRFDGEIERVHVTYT